MSFYSPTGAQDPFSQMITGQPFTGQVMAQPTGFIIPQHTTMPNAANPFGLLGQQTSTGQRPFTTYLTAPDQQNFLQPQATGFNPFRQSMLIPQTTGMALFGVGSAQGTGMSGLGTGMSGLGTSQQPSSNSIPTANQSVVTGFGQSLFNTTPSPFQQQRQQIQTPPLQPLPTSTSAVPSDSMFSTTSQLQSNNNVPPRSASTPLTNLAKSKSPLLKPQMTGTRNPFGPVITPAPPVPKSLTMAELAVMGRGANTTSVGPQQPQQQSTRSDGAGLTNTNTNGFNFANGALGPGGTDMGSVASSFAFANSKHSTMSPTSASTTAGSAFSDSTTRGTSLLGLIGQPANVSSSSAIAATSSLPTGVGNGTSASVGPLKPQITGFAGLKPFKPSSSFGVTLLDSLPPLPNASNATNPPTTSGTNTTSTSNAMVGISSPPFGTSEFGTLNKQQTGFGGTSGGFGALNAGASGFGLSSTASTPVNPLPSVSATLPSGTSNLGVGLRPQPMGGGPANPFRASMAPGNLLSGFDRSGVNSVPPLPTGPGNSSMFGVTSFSPSGSFGNAFGQSQGAGKAQGPQQGQGSASLI